MFNKQKCCTIVDKNSKKAIKNSKKFSKKKVKNFIKEINKNIKRNAKNRNYRAITLSDLTFCFNEEEQKKISNYYKKLNYSCYWMTARTFIVEWKA